MAASNSAMTEAVKLQTNFKAPDVEVTVQCSLFEFYNGAFKEVSFERAYIHSNEEGIKTCEDEITIEVQPGYSE
jgi:DnaJ-class molecular chaperone